MRHCRPVANAHRAQSPAKYQAIGAIIVANEVHRRGSVAERLGDLMREPCCGGVAGHLDMEDSAASLAQHDKGKEPFQAERRNAEHIDADDRIGMVVQESRPALRWPAGARDHISGNGRLGETKAELQEFTMDARCAP